MPRPRKTESVLCPWCKLVEFEPTRGQLATILRGGKAFCSTKCANSFKVWKHAREQRA